MNPAMVMIAANIPRTKRTTISSTIVNADDNLRFIEPPITGLRTLECRLRSRNELYNFVTIEMDWRTKTIFQLHNLPMISKSSEHLLCHSNA